MPPINIQSSARLFGHSLALFFAGLILSSLTSKYPEVANIGHSMVSEVAYPIQSGMEAVAEGVEIFWDEYINLVGLVYENQQLTERLVALEAENSKLLEFGAENERLRKILGLTASLPITGVAANVIGYDPSTWIKAITIDKGSLDGIAEGQSVIDGRGVVGHVISTTAKSARVILLSDHSSAVDSIIQRTRARGVVVGLGLSAAQMNYILEREDVRIGDRVITSGLDGIFPKGLFVGVVTEVNPPARKLFRDVQVEPASDFTKLENVLVITKIKGEIPDVEPVTTPKEVK